MPKKSKPDKKARPEFRFKIEAYRPETMPLARLAKYIGELAEILGESSSVHLVRLEGGSTTLVHEVEIEAVPKILDRTDAVRRGEAPRNAQKAYRRVNEYLRADNARAVFRRSIRGRRILEFPGVDEAEEPYPTVRQHGTITGTIERLGGTGDPVPVILMSEGDLIVGCHADRHVAKGLAPFIFEPVSLSGEGQWTRNQQGVWSLKYFTIESFRRLDNKPLSGAVADLRLIVGDLGEDVFDELMELRHGRRDNGSD